jgi:hypothetical protein
LTRSVSRDSLGDESVNSFSERDETGAILILAMAFLLVVSVIVASLATWTTNNLNNTLQFQSAGSKLYAAEGATEVALRASRYTVPVNTTSVGYVCPGLSNLSKPLVSVNGYYVQDWCVTTATNSSPSYTRQVVLTACLLPSGSSTLTGACQINGNTTVPTLLTAIVDIDDNPLVISSSYNPAVPNCSPGSPSTCGTTMTIISWVPQAA